MGALRKGTPTAWTRSRIAIAGVALVVGACQEECDPAGDLTSQIGTEIDIQIFAAGDGWGTVTAPSSVVDIDCLIKGGAIQTADEFGCRDNFLDVGGVGTFEIHAIPNPEGGTDPASDFVTWRRPKCAAAGSNPVCVVSFNADDSPGQPGIRLEIEAEFVVWSGTLDVTTITDSPGFEPTSFNLLGFGDGQSIGPNETLAWAIPVGEYHVELDVGAWTTCTVSPPNPQSVTVTRDQQTPITFEISCEPPEAQITVTTTTSGVDLDADGYELVVTGSPPPPDAATLGRIGINDEQTFPLEVGAYSLELADVATNCTVTSANPFEFTLDVDSNATPPPSFVIECVAATGRLDVHTSTTGGPADPDAYAVSLDGSEAMPIGANGTVSYADVPVGDHEVLLSSVPSACTVAGDNPRPVTVVEEPPTSTTFEVSCPTPTPPILFESNVDGDFDVYATAGPGGTPVNLTPDSRGGADDDMDPSWSWDNSKIVFRSTRSGSGDIWMMDADGSNPVNLTDNAADNEDPAFSNDGTKIVYEEEDPDDGTFEIFQMDLSTGVVTQLTDDARISEAPLYSPDGSKILFKSDRTGFFDIFLMDPDGENEVNLTNTAWNDFDPSWDPDGSRIVFSRDQSGIEELYFLNPASGAVTPFRVNGLYEWHPVFSTDGSQVVFTSDSDGDYDLYIANADGSGGRVRLTTDNVQRDDDAEFKKPAS